MMVGGIMGGRGDVDIQRDVFHPVRTTWQQTIRHAAGWTIAYLCAILTLALLIWFFWDLEQLGRIIEKIWILLLVPIPIIFGVCFGRMSRLYYAVVIKNPRWPPPLSQVNPLETGFGSAYNFPTFEPEQPAIIVHQIEGTVHNGNGQSKHHRLNTSSPDEWQRFAKWLTLDSVLLRCRFSVRAARRFGVPSEEFDNLQKAWERIGFAERTSRAPNAHYKLTEAGFVWMQELANTPLLD